MPDWFIQTCVIASPPLTMGVAAILKFFHDANKGRLRAIQEKADHIDECVDALKQRVAVIEGRFGIYRGRG